MFADDLKFLASVGARVAQDVKEAEEFCDFISDVKPDSYLEVGVRHGWTFYLVSKVLKPSAKMIAVDLPGVFPWGDDGSDRVFSRIIVEMTPRNPLVVYENSQLESTRDTVKEWCSEIDMTFIDGDHKYEGVKNDWELYGPLTKRYVAFHDIKAKTDHKHKEKQIEVPRLWNEIKGTNYKEIGSNPGIGIILG
jgi:hypothetical protein